MGTVEFENHVNCPFCDEEFDNDDIDTCEIEDDGGSLIFTCQNCKRDFTVDYDSETTIVVDMSVRKIPAKELTRLQKEVEDELERKERVLSGYTECPKKEIPLNKFVGEK